MRLETLVRAAIPDAEVRQDRADRCSIVLPDAEVVVSWCGPDTTLLRVYRQPGSRPTQVCGSGPDTIRTAVAQVLTRADGKTFPWAARLVAEEAVRTAEWFHARRQLAVEQAEKDLQAAQAAAAASAASLARAQRHLARLAPTPGGAL